MNMFHILAGTLVFAGLASAQQVTATATATTTVEVRKAERSFVHKALYPLSTCVVTDELLEGDKVKVFEVDGRTYKVCCGRCQKKVEADPAPFAAKLDAALVAQQLPNYPLDVCVITGKKLGAMGDPVQLVLDGTLVQLCCKGCTKKAIAGAEEIVQRIRTAAFEAQLASYPLKNCVVADLELGADTVDVMYGTSLVRFCCESCIEDFEKEPAVFLAKIERARSGAKQGAGGDCGTECLEGLTIPSAGSGAKSVGKSDCGTECLEGLTITGAGSGAKPATKGDDCCGEEKAVSGAKSAGKSDCGTECLGGLTITGAGAGAKPAAKGDGCCGETPAAKPAKAKSAKKTG